MAANIFACLLHIKKSFVGHTLQQAEHRTPCIGRQSLGTGLPGGPSLRSYPYYLFFAKIGIILSSILYSAFCAEC